MDHHSAAHIDTHMGNGAIASIGFREENQVPGLCVGR